MRKTFFKFGLEGSLLILLLGSVGINTLGGRDAAAFAPNRLLSYLSNHADINKFILEQVRTQKIHITPERERLISAAQAATLNSLLSAGTSQLLVDAGNDSHGELPLPLSDQGVLMKPNYSSRDALIRRDIQEYTVKTGDSIIKIATTFGVSAMTIMYENKLSDKDYIRPGQVLKILPTTGIKHIVQKNETIEQIAQKYKVDPESILEFNEIEVPEDIQAGESLIIPDGQAQPPESAKSKTANYQRVDVKRASIPAEFAGSGTSLIWPLATHNITQYYSSKHRALDISNGQRPQFWAASDGIVELSGWQAGYGQTIIINHGNGLKSRYAHASELYVTAGDRVSQGQIIGRVGNTGRVYGRTGNHLHFEIIRSDTKYDPLGWLH